MSSTSLPSPPPPPQCPNQEKQKVYFLLTWIKSCKKSLTKSQRDDLQTLKSRMIWTKQELKCKRKNTSNCYRGSLNCLYNTRAEDVGLSDNLRLGTPRVTYTTTYKCTNFTHVLNFVLFLSVNSDIPLHNHPRMTLFIGIDAHQIVRLVGLARLKANNVFTAPCETSVLYPTTGGNIHEFTAITPCTVLDVLDPPYSKQDGHDCSYYKDHPYASYSNYKARWRELWLVGRDWDGIEYLGPQIIENW
ncbi:hypothetical protein UlMin_006880 [Ulmus minor]